jgi:hypothetical protein
VDPVKPGGKMVLGQDQDTLGGGFQATIICFFTNNMQNIRTPSGAAFRKPSSVFSSFK